MHVKVTVVVLVVAVGPYCPLMKTFGITALGFDVVHLTAVPCTFGLLYQTVHIYM